MRQVRRIPYYGLLAGVVAITLIACQGPAWEDDPQVQAARIACAGLRKTEHFDCIEARAVATLNPDVCRLAFVDLDEFCLRTLYEAAGDPAICDRIYLQEVEDNCRAWYAEDSP